MKSGNAIEVSNVTKTFRVYLDKGNLLKEKVIFPGRNRYEERKVLRGISFEVKRGEAVGLIGKNGCGKSTSLKLLTRILYPNSGKVEIDGRVSSLIELGAGFHQDMTGRENVYTNASIFGLTRKETDKRLNDIIRFSELEAYIDNPVRTYSSGMYMRLAFSVAINVDAEVLLIDEILAVGDVSFQKKCFNKLKEIKKNGTTIVIVSHSMDQMYKICDRLIWIEDGLIKEIGKPKLIGEKYSASMEGRRLERIEAEEKQKKEEVEEKLKDNEEQKDKENLEKQRKIMEKNESAKSLTKFYRPGARREGLWDVKYTGVQMLNEKGEETNVFKTGERIKICMQYESQKLGIPVNFIIGFTKDEEIYCYGSTIKLDIDKLVPAKLKGEACITIDNRLLDGKYVLDVRIRNEDGDFFDNIYSLMEFQVKNKNVREAGILNMEHEWQIDNVAYKTLEMNDKGF